jgi:hypothetical protein
MLFKINLQKDTEQIVCWRPPTEWEIKFGEGALHYRDFTADEIGRNRKGELKQWFKANDDGLRYYTR